MADGLTVLGILRLGPHPTPVWSLVPVTVQKRLEAPANLMLFSGMALGFADPDHPVNTLRTERAPLDEFAILNGFDRG